MRLLDSRRLTGPNLLCDGPGAILDVEIASEEERSRLATAWRAAIAALQARLGEWISPEAFVRAHERGLSLVIEATPDVLYAATEANEAALRLAEHAIGNDSGVAESEIAAAVAALRPAFEREQKPWLRELAAEADRHGITWLADDKRVSVGLGAGSRAWPAEESGRVLDRIPWNALYDVPVALVTGTNGKTTTVRLLGAIAAAAGRVAGVTSTDRVTIGDEVVAEGDYSGPNGARTVLRDRRVEIAILELARGGILRRGLGVPRARVAVVTNVANDHLGEYGIFDVGSLADVKMVVAKAIPTDGRIVLNADDALVRERGLRLEGPVIWFTLDPRHPVLADHVERGGEACVLDGDDLVHVRGSQRIVVCGVADAPITFRGAARHNVANALAAIGAAVALGLPIDSIRRGLSRFEATHSANPGRANVWALGGATAIVDFAHNPHGLGALVDWARSMPATRRAIVIGQAGDRDDDAIREFARCAAALRPEHVFIKDMDVYLRGREPGVVPALLEAELRRAGVSSTTRHESEMEAVRAALAWAREGDLLLLTTHAQRDEVTRLMEGLVASSWRPGMPLEVS